MEAYYDTIMLESERRQRSRLELLKQTRDGKPIVMTGNHTHTSGAPQKQEIHQGPNARRPVGRRLSCSSSESSFESGTESEGAVTIKTNSFRDKCMSNAIRQQITKIVARLPFKESEIPDKIIQDAIASSTECERLMKLRTTEDQVSGLVSLVITKDLSRMEKFLDIVNAHCSDLVEGIRRVFAEMVSDSMLPKMPCVVCELKQKCDIKSVYNYFFEKGHLSCNLHGKIVQSTLPVGSQEPLWTKLLTELDQHTDCGVIKVFIWALQDNDTCNSNLIEMLQRIARKNKPLKCSCKGQILRPIKPSLSSGKPVRNGFRMATTPPGTRPGVYESGVVYLDKDHPEYRFTALSKGIPTRDVLYLDDGTDGTVIDITDTAGATKETIIPKAVKKRQPSNGYEIIRPWCDIPSSTITTSGRKRGIEKHDTAGATKETIIPKAVKKRQPSNGYEIIRPWCDIPSSTITTSGRKRGIEKHDTEQQLAKKMKRKEDFTQRVPGIDLT